MSYKGFVWVAFLALPVSAAPAPLPATVAIEGTWEVIDGGHPYPVRFFRDGRFSPGKEEAPNKDREWLYARYSYNHRTGEFQIIASMEGPDAGTIDGELYEPWCLSGRINAKKGTGIYWYTRNNPHPPIIYEMRRSGQR